MKHSEQREIVYNVVMNSCDHPTAETILIRAKKDKPSINLATVYRNLASLSKQGKILRINVDDGDRFDKTTSPHAHFHCTNCGKVFDVNAKDIQCCYNTVARENGCRIDKVDMVFTGCCKECLEKENYNK